MSYGSYLETKKDIALADRLGFQPAGACVNWIDICGNRTVLTLSLADGSASARRIESAPCNNESALWIVPSGDTVSINDVRGAQAY